MSKLPPHFSSHLNETCYTWSLWCFKSVKGKLRINLQTVLGILLPQKISPLSSHDCETKSDSSDVQGNNNPLTVMTIAEICQLVLLLLEFWKATWRKPVFFAISLFSWTFSLFSSFKTLVLILTHCYKPFRFINWRCLFVCPSVNILI